MPARAGPRLTLVVAMDEAGGIGLDNALPWRIPGDLRRFRRLTLGKPVIMGRRTFESIGRALDGRRNLVLSRRPGFAAPGCEVAATLEEALARLGGAPEAMVIGGAAVYAAALPVASRIEITRVRGRHRADTFFPALDPRQWREVAREEIAAAPGVPAHAFVTLARRPAR